MKVFTKLEWYQQKCINRSDAHAEKSVSTSAIRAVVNTTFHRAMVIDRKIALTEGSDNSKISTVRRRFQILININMDRLIRTLQTQW